jgi:hypothetical protein
MSIVLQKHIEGRGRDEHHDVGVCLEKVDKALVGVAAGPHDCPNRKEGQPERENYYCGGKSKGEPDKGNENNADYGPNLEIRGHGGVVVIMAVVAAAAAKRQEQDEE